MIFVLLVGCGGPPPQQVVNNGTRQSTTTTDRTAPFEYRVVKTDETPHFMGPQVVVRLETTNEVAKAATDDDLKQLWRHMGPGLGDRRVFIQLHTGVPGASNWGLISRVNLTGKWQLTFTKFQGGIDAEPYYFVDKIDRTKRNQQAMILTLPVVNRIVERLKLSGWTETYRSEDLVKLEQPAPGLESFNVTLSPEGIELDAWHKDDLAIFDAIELLTEEFGIGDDIKRKMQSVIGSPEYFRGNGNGVGVWYWTIRDYDVSYSHTDHGPRQSVDNVSIGYASAR
jgi:hypothetical protein